jgi:murein DD-endopeptidase MepM/ murein hydrolase activator NlpD
MRVDAGLVRSDPRASSDTVAAAKDLEAWFVAYLAKELRSGLAGGGPLGEGAASAFADMFDQEIGRAVSAGQGIGLAAQLARDFQGAEAPPEGRRGGEPVAGAGRVTSGFGMRHDPLHGELRRHDGVDIAAPVGTPIRAPKDGVVRFAGDRGGYGNVVYLDHGDGTESRYAHCDALAVRAGQVVRSGDVIASVGSTGRSTGPHLHLELRANGAALDPSALVPGVLGGSGGLAPLDSTGELSSELP